MGCFNDNSWNCVLPHMAQMGCVSVDNCISYCIDKDYLYVGLQIGFQCFCGVKGYDKHGEVTRWDTDQCDRDW